jgi:hypothetical protein
MPDTEQVLHALWDALSHILENPNNTIAFGERATAIKAIDDAFLWQYSTPHPENPEISAD